MLSKGTTIAAAGAVLWGIISKFVEPFSTMGVLAAILIAGKNKKLNLAFLFYLVWILTYTLVTQA